MKPRRTAHLLALAGSLLLSPALARAQPPDPTVADSSARTAGFVALGAGGVGIAAGLGLGVASVIEHRRSRDLLSRTDFEDEEQALAASTEYQAAIDARDDLRLASGLSAAVGLGAFLAAGVLFAVDEARSTTDTLVGRPAPLSATPALGPGYAGGAATLRF